MISSAVKLKKFIKLGQIISSTFSSTVKLVCFIRKSILIFNNSKIIDKLSDTLDKFEFYYVNSVQIKWVESSTIFSELFTAKISQSEKKYY